VLANRGAAYRRSNRIDQALADYDTALGAGAATPALLVNRGIALAALNRHEEAIAQYDRAIALDARHAPAISIAG
jgi:tetratricopeptide (TPR) repeat protein